MTSPQRLLIDQLILWLQAEVPDADGWTYYTEEPRDYAGGQNCAVWWMGDEPFVGDSTTKWIGLADQYSIRYWEPAEDPSRVALDAVNAERVRDTLSSVRRCVFAHYGLPAASLESASVMEYVGSRALGPQDDASSIRGFEVLVRVRRPETL